MESIPNISDHFDPDETVILSRYMRQGEDGDGNLFHQWGPYRLGEILGKGGLGMVFEARLADGSEGKCVALKVPRPNLLDRPEVFELLAREARQISSLDHPNILPVLDCSTDPSCPFLAMPLMAGRSLAHYLTRQTEPISLERILKWSQQLAAALSYTHKKRGIIHRDLKPENILLDDDENVLLTDFGLFQETTHDSTEEIMGNGVIGSLPYVPPEIYRGEKVDPRGDIYALGVVMYQLVCGQLPFKGKTYDELKQRVLSDTPDSLLTLRSDLPASLVGVIEKAMARELEDRFPSMDSVRRALEKIATDARVVASSIRIRKGDALRQDSQLSLVVGVILILMLGWGLYSSTVDRRSTEENQIPVRQPAARLTMSSEFPLSEIPNNYHSFLPIQWFADPAKEIVCFDDKEAAVVALDGEVLARFSMEGWELVTEGRSFMAADIDGDGLEEPFLVWRNGKNLRLSIFDQHKMEVRRFEATGNYKTGEREGTRMAYDSFMVPLHWGDIDGDGRPEVLVALRTGHLLSPRALLCFDGEDESEKWRYPIANEFNGLELVDNPVSGEREIWIAGAAVGNGATMSDGSNDEVSYLYRIATNGIPIDRHKTGECYSYLNCRRAGENVVVLTTTSVQPDVSTERQRGYYLLDVETGEITWVTRDRVPQNVIRTFGLDCSLQAELYVNAPILIEPIIIKTQADDRLVISIEDGRLFEVDLQLSKVHSRRILGRQLENTEKVYCRFVGAADWVGNARKELAFIVMDQIRWIQNSESTIEKPPTQTSVYQQRLVVLGEGLNVVASSPILDREAKVSFTGFVDDLDGDFRSEVICLKDRGMIFQVIPE